MKRISVACASAIVVHLSFLTICFAGQGDANESKVTEVPEEIIKKYKLDTTFYKKHLEYKGFSILSSAKVSDAGLYEARYLIDKLLGEREDILKAMIKAGCRFMVMAPTEMTTDVPEQRHMKNDPKTNWDTRARGLGGKLSSCGEENLLNLKGDRYRQENILIHEFNHAIHQQGLRSVDPTFNGRLKKAYDDAISKGLWKGTYVATNSAEYWAEGAQAYFDCMRPQFGANTREKLQKYDAGLFALVDEVYKQSKYRYVRYDQRQKEKAEGKKEAEIAMPAGPLMLVGGRHPDLPTTLRDLFFKLSGEFDPFANAIAIKPRLVGINIDPDTAVIIRGKELKVHGNGAVTIRIAQDDGTLAKNEVLKAGSTQDMQELRKIVMAGSKR